MGANDDRTLSAAGEGLIHGFECLRLQAYDDATSKSWDGVSPLKGNPTIGWGHVLTKPELLGGFWRAGISRAMADALFRKDASWACQAVRELCTVALTQHEFDALVSFTFNGGRGMLGGRPEGTGDLLRLVNSGERDPERVKATFGEYVMFQHKPNPGLKLRRAREAALFLTPDVNGNTITATAVLAGVYVVADRIVDELYGGLTPSS